MHGPPVTTLAWRLLHISDGNTIYWEHAFGPGLRNFWDLAPHGDTAGAIDYLVESQQPIRSALLAYLEWGTRLALQNSQRGAEVAPEAPVPRWGWGEAPPFEG